MLRDMIISGYTRRANTDLRRSTTAASSAVLRVLVSAVLIVGCDQTTAPTASDEPDFAGSLVKLQGFDVLLDSSTGASVIIPDPEDRSGTTVRPESEGSVAEWFASDPEGRCVRSDRSVVVSAGHGGSTVHLYGVEETLDQQPLVVGGQLTISSCLADTDE